MFENNKKQEMNIFKPYMQNQKKWWVGIKERKRLRNRGATINCPTHKMDRKKRACYPRGKAFLEVLELNSLEHL